MTTNKLMNDFRDELLALMNKHGVYLVIQEIGFVESGFMVAAFQVTGEKTLSPILMGKPQFYEDSAEPLDT